MTADHVVKDDGIQQLDLFTDVEKLEKEKKLQKSLLSLQKRFGKDAVKKGTSLQEGSTLQQRNNQIGGHRK